MTADQDFARSLANFLAFHTDQSAGDLNVLINAYLRGAQGSPKPEPAAQIELMNQLRAEVEANNDVPTFLQNYLHERLTGGRWSAHGAFIASRYLRRRASGRFVAWPQRQQLIADLNGEPLRGSELSYRQMLYSQGAGSVLSWRGMSCFKSCYDMCIYAMLLDELRPATIVELGSGTGGSALFFADLCASFGLATRVLSIDNTPGAAPDSRISFVQADCAEWLAATAKSRPELPRPCLMIEDFHGDLAGFFGSMDSILETGDYLVIEDSYSKQDRIAQAITNRSYLIDTKYTDFFGINCTSAINSILVKRAGA
jgi:cephalosporin hydroxylase